MKYTEDIIVFGSKRPTFNRQMMRRESPRIGEMQHGNSKRHNTKSQVSFNTKYAPESWNVYDANRKNPSDYLKFSAVANNSKEKTDHPTQKPVKLLSYLIKTYTNPGDVVLDNCMGSGSTGVSCVETSRNFIGMEMDPHYFDVAKHRIEEAQK